MSTTVKPTATMAQRVAPFRMLAKLNRFRKLGAMAAITTNTMPNMM